ncbi:MAG: peptidoglycan DD-metalloendopeptidase family protein [Firmicutes bacterium]|nr:peptidoglycan DD-metalloendopeptidase family protein [Bacillota bacterium]
MRRWLRRAFAAIGRWGFTVMIIPKRGEIRRVQIPWLGAILSGLAILALGFFLGYSAWYYPQSQLDIVQLKASNERLRKENEKVKPALERARQLEDLINRYIKTVTGIDQVYRSIQRKSPARRLSSRSGTLHSAVYRLPDPVIAPEDRKVSLLATLEIQTASLNEEVSRRLTEAERLREELLAYERLLDHTPSIWPVRGRLTSRFGYRRDPFTGQTAMHYGIDLAVPAGTPVRSAADGVVAEAGYRNGYGRTIIINHGYGYQTLYGHNSQLLVRAGQKVKKGQIIARSGSTGRSTSPHLHYEVRLNGKPVNPSAYLW